MKEIEKTEREKKKKTCTLTAEMELALPALLQTFSGFV